MGARLLADHFELVEIAGAGGMGTVWRGRDARSGEAVAVKLLHVEDDVRVSRFDREARLLAELSHPGLPRYVSHGATPEGERYLVMEWLEGLDLAQRLVAGALSLDDSLTLVARAAEALGVAHAAGVVHRDVKPSNLFLIGGDVARVKVLDFGVARWVRMSRDHTRAGHRIGTPRYMAPEQVRGARDIDARADVFALGCVLFACLTGRAAFTGDEEMAVLAKILLEEAPRASELSPAIPPDVDDLVARMMDKEPQRRPRDGRAVADAIAALRRGEASGARHEPALGPGEKRLLSVVMARTDAFGDETPPPVGVDTVEVTQAASVPGALIRELASIAWRHGGQLERLADGTLLVTVVGTGPATDQAARAARLAMAMRRIIPEAPMALATGSGEVAPLPVGEVIDRAAALLRTCEAGAFRTDDVTAGLLGEAEPGRATPFVGRDLELRTLLAMLDECVSEPTARAVVCVAGPGVGKSRLLREATRVLCGSVAALEVWSVRADPLRAGSPFALLGGLLRGVVGIVEGEPAGDRWRRLRSWVAGRTPSSSADRVATFLGEIAGVPQPSGVELRAARDDARLMGDQIRRAWEELCAAGGPLLIVVDDLHWADVSSVRLIDAGLRAAAERPLLVLAAARPEVESAFPRLWEGRKLTRLELGALSRRAAERWVREALGERAPTGRVAALVTRAAGNAYFLEELIRHADRDEHDLPPTILAMIQARLEELPPTGRRVLRAASIFGTVFWTGGVAALRKETVDAELMALSARDLVVPREGSRFAGETEWAFASELLREAALRTLTDADRTLGHRLAGEWLAAKGETDAMVLAEHFVLGGEPARAVAGFAAAAEQALAGDDLPAVLARVERGLAAGAEGEPLGRLCSAAAEAHVWRGELAQAEAWGDRALAALAPGTPRWFLAAGVAADCSGRLGHGERLASVSGHLLERAEPSRAWAIAAARASAVLFFAGRYELGSSLLAKIDELARAVVEGDPAVEAVVHRARALQALISGDPAAGLRHWPAAVAACERAGDRRGALQARANLANRYKELGGYDQAAAVLAEVLAGADALRLSTVATVARHNLGMILASRGEVRRGRAIEEEAIRELMAQGDKRLEASARAYLSGMLLELGEHDAAEIEAEAAVRLAAASPPSRALALAALARARLQRGAAAEAVPDAREAMATLERLGAFPERDTFVRLVHAQVLAAAGMTAEAAAAAADARARLAATAEKIADPVWRQSFLENVPDHRETMNLSVSPGTAPPPSAAG